MAHTIFTLKLDDSLRKSLQKLADAERRSLGNYIHIQLEKIVSGVDGARRSNKKSNSK